MSSVSIYNSNVYFYNSNCECDSSKKKLKHNSPCCELSNIKNYKLNCHTGTNCHTGPNFHNDTISHTGTNCHTGPTNYTGTTNHTGTNCNTLPNNNTGHNCSHLLDLNNKNIVFNIGFNIV